MISVITLTYNNFNELLKTCESLEGVPGEFEHLVINGGSCEKTKDFLASKFHGRQISEPDDGIADAFNKGVTHARGQGVYFLNSGDVLLDNKYIESMNKLLGDYDLVYGNILFDDPLAGVIRLKSRHGQFGRGMPYPHQALTVRKELFDKVGGFDDSYKIYMDFEWLCRIQKLNPKGRYYDQDVALMAGGGISGQKEVAGMIESKRAMDKHGLWTPKQLGYFLKRVVLYSIRRLLVIFGLSALLAHLKRRFRR